MLTYLFELFFLVLPKLTVFFDVIVGSIVTLIFLPDYLNSWFPELTSYLVFEAVYWLYFAALSAVAIIFIIQSIRKLPSITQSTKNHLRTLTTRHWVALGLLIFLILFPGILAAQSLDYMFYGDGEIGFSILMILFFFVITGHAAAVVFIIFGLANFIWGYAKHYTHIRKISRRIPSQLLKAVQTLILIYPLIAGASSVGWFLTEGSDRAQAGSFFTINAAIKNTCFIDPKRENCPHTLEEIGYIEPQEYKRMTDCCQVQYQYNSADNQYSLVVRYTPTRAVVFDWRLVTPEYQLDFKEYDVSIIGQDQLVDPPAWDGPWQFEDWEYL